MANNYSIEIVRLYTNKKFVDGDVTLYNVITRVDYRWIAESPSGTIKSIGFTRDLEPPTEDFKEFTDIDKGEVQNWVNQDNERNTAILVLDEQIELEEAERFVETPLPWNEISE
jgi:hypothetical protein